MTIVNWYKPIDPWMKDKVLSMLSETNTFPYNNLNRIIAALAFIVIEKVPCATLADIESLCEDVERNYTLSTLAQNNSQLVFNMEPSDDGYVLNKNYFMLTAAKEAEKLITQKFYWKAGFYPFSDALEDLKKLTDEIK